MRSAFRSIVTGFVAAGGMTDREAARALLAAAPAGALVVVIVG